MKFFKVYSFLVKSAWTENKKLFLLGMAIVALSLTNAVVAILSYPFPYGFYLFATSVALAFSFFGFTIFACDAILVRKILQDIYEQAEAAEQGGDK